MLTTTQKQQNSDKKNMFSGAMIFCLDENGSLICESD